MNIARSLLQLDMNWPRALSRVSKQVNIAEDCDVQGELGGAQEGCGAEVNMRVEQGCKNALIFLTPVKTHFQTS